MLAWPVVLKTLLEAPEACYGTPPTMTGPRHSSAQQSSGAASTASTAAGLVADVEESATGLTGLPFAEPCVGDVTV